MRGEKKGKKYLSAVQERPRDRVGKDTIDRSCVVKIRSRERKGKKEP